MNQFFSFDRFNLLVAKHWADNRKRYVLSVLAFIGLLITWFVLAILLEGENAMAPDVQESAFFFLLFVLGTFYASQYYSDLSSKSKGSNFLLVPASSFEKFLCSLFYTVVVFFIVFTAAYYLVDTIMVSLFNNLPVADLTKKATVINIFKVDFFRFNDDHTLNFLLFFFSIQSAFLLGSVYFRKYNFIKTIICGFIAWFILFGLTYLLYQELYPNGEEPEQFPNWLTQIVRIVSMYVIAPVFWIVTYYRLKTKQV